MPTSSTLQFDKLRLSSRQEHVPNTDPALRGWPVFYVWTEGLILLKATKAILAPLVELDADIQQGFWQGNVPNELMNLLPTKLGKCSPARVLEYCRVWQSYKKGQSCLIIKARKDKLNPNGAMSLGGFRLDERTYAFGVAARAKAVNVGRLPYFLNRAIEQNDVRFFIRLGRALQSKHRPAEVDWKRCPPVACFMVENWCEGCDYRSQLPALCLFTDQSLADFCSVAFGRAPGNPSAAVIRQWRRRLGLKQVRSPKIRKVTIKGDQLHFS